LRLGDVKRREKRSLVLSEALEKESADWKQKGYAALARLTYPISYERGPESDSHSYQVEVDLLEKNEQYIQIIVSVDDGGISAFCPPSSILEVRASGDSAN
jgi:hypothetical protein